MGRIKRRRRRLWYGDALVVECAREKQAKEQIEKMNGWSSETLDMDCPCRRRQGAPGRPRNRPSPGFYSFDEFPSYNLGYLYRSGATNEISNS